MPLMSEQEALKYYTSIFWTITEQDVIELRQEHICSCKTLKTQELDGFLITFCNICNLIIKMEVLE